MTTISGRDKSALLVIDVQVAVVWEAFERDERIANIGRLVDQARANGTSVIWVQHSEEELPIGSDGWQIVPELKPAPEEHIVHKLWRSSFEQTDLESTLARLNVGHLIVCGAESNNCVRHTIHAALERGYDATLVSDAHTTTDVRWFTGNLPAQIVIEEQNRSCYMYDLPGRANRCVPTAEVFGAA